jgi:hypothetical protein
MPASDALALLADHVKPDPTYQPLKDEHSLRWHASTARGEFEILTTGVKWYDTRARRRWRRHRLGDAPARCVVRRGCQASDREVDRDGDDHPQGLIAESADVATRLAPMAAKALTLSLREPRPAGFPLLSPSTGS